MIPLLISAVSGASVSYFLIGPEATLHFPVEGSFILTNIPYYILLGIIAGFINIFRIADSFRKK
jgi:CIC family chloride channel protein